MAFSSKAQIDKFKQLRKEGKLGLVDIALKAFGTDLSKLPERVDRDNDATSSTKNPKN